MIRNRWNAQPTRRKVLWVIGGVVILLLLSATVWSLVAWSLSPKTVATGDTRPASVSPSPGSEEPHEPDASLSASSDASRSFKFELDATGMAVMPVTSDPAEAAAGAAAVMWNIPATKMTRQEFFDEAIRRITYPAPNYVGPEGQIHTMVVGKRFDLPDHRIYMAPDVAMAAKVKKAGERDDRVHPYEWFPWVIAEGNRYDVLRQIGVNQTGVPILVMSEDEMRAWAPDSTPVIPLPADIDWTPDTPGATITTWYVLTEINDGLVGDGEGQKVGVALDIWCDSPAQGGVCGVASTLDLELPLNWPEKSR